MNYFCTWEGSIRNTTIVGLLLLCLLLSSTAVAQQAADLTQASLEELMEIKVYSASRHTQTASEAPSSVTVVTAEDIQKYGYRTLADALRSVRGFYISYDRTYSYAGVRGFARPGDYNTRILLLVDGHRLNDSVYEQGAIGTDFPLDLDLIERIEVIRGPSSSLYGTDAFFGVVNVITRRGKDIGGVELSADAGSFGTYHGRATYGNHVHGLDWVLSGSYYSSQGHHRLFFPEFNSPLTNSGVAVNADDDQLSSGFALLSFRGLTLQASYGTREKGDPTAAFDAAFNDPRNRATDTHGYLDLSYERQVGNGWDLLTRVYYDRYAYDGTTIYSSDTTRAYLYPNIDVGRGSRWGTDVQVSKTLLRRHKLTGGWEYRNNFRQDQANYNLDPVQVLLDDHRASDVWAGYVEDEFKISHRLTLNAGFRHDHDSEFGSSTTPRVALIVDPWKTTTWKLIYGSAFRAANVYELYYSVSPLSAVSAPLSPERIQSWEFAWEQKFGKRFAADASLFSNRIRDLIDVQTDNENTIFRNRGRVHAAGAGMEFLAKLPHRIEGRASYSFHSVRDVQTEQRLTNSPTQLVKVNLAFPLLDNRFVTAVEAQYTGERLTLEGGHVAGYSLLNLTFTAHKIAKWTDVSASTYNLLNQRYYDPGAQQHRQDAIAQDGRSFRVKLTWRFGGN